MIYTLHDYLRTCIKGGGGGVRGGGERRSENTRPENNFFNNTERKIIPTEIKEREIRKQITTQNENNIVNV